MSRTFFIIFFLSLMVSLEVGAQTNKARTTYRFDFGSGKVANGYEGVSAATAYSKERGFGFESTTGLLNVRRKGNDPLRDDFITSKEPIFFSVKLPEGNYNISLLTGDREGTSQQTVRVECRRMLVQNIKTRNGEVKRSDFTVNIRDSIIRNTGKTVRLKAREHDYYHWDDKITFEFNGDNPKIVALEISPATNIITVFLAGNSTVVDQASEPYAAWGQMIPAFFQPRQVAICNLAESGESLSSFISARRLEKAFSMMKPGDYIFVEFAHNDQKQKGEGIGAFTSYKRDLKYLIDQARRKGAIPVLVTSMHRRSFDSARKIIHTLGDYPEAMRQAAREERAALIDLNAMSKVLYEAWGETGSLKAFVHYPANSFPGQDNALSDNTHFNPYGAYEIARCMVNGIKENVPALAEHLRNDIEPFDPSRPDAVTGFYWPLSKKVTTIKPDGN